MSHHRPPVVTTTTVSSSKSIFFRLDHRVAIGGAVVFITVTGALYWGLLRHCNYYHCDYAPWNHPLASDVAWVVILVFLLGIMPLLLALWTVPLLGMTTRVKKRLDQLDVELVGNDRMLCLVLALRLGCCMVLLTVMLVPWVFLLVRTGIVVMIVLLCAPTDDDKEVALSEDPTLSEEDLAAICTTDDPNDAEPCPWPVVLGGKLMILVTLVAFIVIYRKLWLAMEKNHFLFETHPAATTTTTATAPQHHGHHRPHVPRNPPPLSVSTTTTNTGVMYRTVFLPEPSGLAEEPPSPALIKKKMEGPTLSFSETVNSSREPRPHPQLICHPHNKEDTDNDNDDDDGDNTEIDTMSM